MVLYQGDNFKVRRTNSQHENDFLNFNLLNENQIDNNIFDDKTYNKQDETFDIPNIANDL